MNFLRRLISTWRVFLLVSTLVIGFGYLALSFVADTYESSAKLAIERADEFVFGDDSPDADALSQRIHLIISNVFRRENVFRILEESDAIASDADAVERAEALSKFQDRARIDFDNVSTINSYTGRLGLMSLGLDITYTDENPEIAFKVANLLTNDMLAGSRSAEPIGESVSSAETFLAQEVESTLEKLVEIGQQISDFKNSNSLSLPELYPVTISELQDIDNQIERAKDNIADLQRNIDATTTDLAVTNPDALLVSDDGTRIESVEEQLQQMRVDLAFASSRYSSSHPQVVNLSREIAALEEHASGTDTRLLETELNGAQARLAELQGRYSDTHPDVVATNRNIARLNAAIQDTASNSAPQNSSQPSNPAYVRFEARAAALRDELNRELRNLGQLQAQQIEQRELLKSIPGVELELAELQRTQSSEEQRYIELEQQLTAARLSNSMRGADLLGQIVVIDPPVIPLSPAAPRRKLLLALLIVLGLGAATAAALVSLLLRDAIWERDQLSSMIEGQVVQVPRF